MIEEPYFDARFDEDVDASWVSILGFEDDFVDAEVDKSDRAIVARREGKIRFLLGRIPISSLDQSINLGM